LTDRDQCLIFSIIMADVTQVLEAAARGETHAAAELLPLIYDELRQLAGRHLAHESPGHTLQPTALVHEAYLRLLGAQAKEPRGQESEGAEGPAPGWKGRGHFFAAAAEAMRRILIENARRKKRHRHGGGCKRVELEGRDVAAGHPPEELLAIDDALTRLATEDPEAAEVVKLRFFAGLSIEEAADALGISRAGAYRHWTYARAWLRTALGGEEGDAGDAGGQESPPA
jgi:RNA polymerase sigma factor (sigma-70 family)